MNKELFNLKTVERFSSKIELNNKQKIAAKSWLYLLEQGKLKKEKLNYIKFVEYILKDILGYDIRKDMDFEAGNIEFSFKNKQGKTILGIEAKGTKTKDLFAEQKGYREGQKTPVNQLWTYMGKLNLDYGIATNYKDFVLIDRTKGSSTHHFFDFEEIRNNDNKLKEFIAIFSKEQIIDNNFVEKLKEESDIEERNFTKEFYKLFHETRLMLLKEFQENGIPKEESIHYAQLYLNRLMFVFFAEDTSKLEKRLFENLVVKVLDSGMPITEHTHFISEAVRGLFRSLDKGSKTPTKIFGFNGGLFCEEISPNIYFKDLRDKKFYVEIYQHSKLKKEPELDPISKKIFLKYENKINPIIKNLLVMASFDFNTEVSVNILGHIFEQSLSDLEELKEGKTTKRKKEGIYYTPEYITDYICRNTIIPYLSKGKASTPRELVLEHQKKIKELEDKFASIKILDPACGSGAFLIKAVDILLEIHKEIQLFKQDKGEYTAIKKGRKKKKDEGQLMLVKWNEEDEAREIIEKNIFGVDLNEESVEITKLSLFLKIAKKNKKLIDLSKNIKCGNSLINDKEIDPRAFNWEKEFPFKFDVVIGNPPYVRVQELGYNQIDYFKDNYKVAHKRVDISLMFFELGCNLLKKDGKLGFISSVQFLNAEYGRKLRKLFLTKKINVFIDFNGQPVFEDATTYPGIVILSNSQPTDFDYYKVLELNKEVINSLSNIKQFQSSTKYIINAKVNLSQLSEEVWVLGKKEKSKLVETIKTNKQVLSEIANPCTGFTTGADKLLIFTEEQIKEKKFEKEILLPIVRGRNLSRWSVGPPFDYVFYPYKIENSKTTIIEEKILKIKYPNLYSHLVANKKELLNRKDSRKSIADKKDWYGLIRKGRLNLFKSSKILTPGVSKNNSFALDTDGLAYVCGGAGVFGLIQNEFDNYFLLGILNSKVVEYFLHSISTKKQGGYYSYLNSFLSKIPVPKEENKEISMAVKEIIKTKSELINKKAKFFNRIKRSFNLKNINRKIDLFYELEFNDFIKEIEKQSKKRISLKEQDDWEDYFKNYKKELLKLKDEIDKIDRQINEIVYKLYRLTKQEINVIENSFNKKGD